MSPPSLQQARSHHARQAGIAAAAALAIRRLFTRGSGWRDILSTFASYQFAAAEASSLTMASLAGTRPQVRPATFAGTSSAGFPLFEPLVATIDAVVPAPVEALPQAWWDDARAFMAQVEQLIASEVADAGRAAFQAEMAAAPDWQNYVRVLVPPSCKRCVVLAGRIYRDLDGFKRHPNCFPAGTVVSGPAVRGATRRWYEGELVVVRTAGGKELTATANHPVLTDQGWLPANLLNEGGYVVSRASGDRSGSLLVPDHDQVPARIEDLWSSDAMGPFGRVPVATEDFHGDGFGSSHVDVVLADRLMWNRGQVPLLKQSSQGHLPLRVEDPVALDPARSATQLLVGHSLAPAGGVGGFGLSAELGARRLAGAEESGLAGMAHWHPSLDQSVTHDAARHAQTVRDGVLTLPAHVGRDDRSVVNVSSAAHGPRWDAPAAKFSMETRAAYASSGVDLRSRLAGQVELDRIVEVSRVQWSGHVYNLTSSEGWYDANGIIVSNCDCVHWPVQDWDEAHEAGLVSSPQEAFEKGHIRDLTAGERQAIEDGANITTVINSASGIYTADLFGRRVKATRYGTTKRSAWRKANPSRLVRLRPEAIYRIADGSRDEALRLLRLYGYLK